MFGMIWNMKFLNAKQNQVLKFQLISSDYGVKRIHTIFVPIEEQFTYLFG